MFNKNQLVEVKWNNKNRKYYESKGYVFTNYNDSFYVKAKDLSVGSRNKINVICDFCGKTYTPSYMNYNRRSNKKFDSCNSCKTRKQWTCNKENRAKEKFDIARNICKENDYQLITGEDEFAGANTVIKYICGKHGLQKQSLDNMIHGHRCYFCSYEKRGLNCRYSKEEVIRIINSVNNNILLNPDDYVGVFEKNLRIKCGECGREYITSLDSYMHKNQTRCKHCSKSESVGEFRIRKFLEINNIYFEQEKTFNDCKDKRALPFDFYLPDYNLCIEFDGKQHYSDVGYGDYETLSKHDKIKNEYCASKNIGLLRISYLDGNNIEKIISKQLNL